MDSAWDRSYLNHFIPSVELFRESKHLSKYDKEQLDNGIVSINGKYFINHKPFVIAYSLNHIDWGCVDAIFISYVDSFMLLPILLRETEFSGVVYTTHSIFEVFC